MVLSRTLAVLLMATALSAAAQAQKQVIAHRGASAYLPEHTLPAKAMAYAMGAHYIEQDVVMTRDDELIVLHDITLDRTTDVAQRFPDRARADGRFYAIDFDLDEIRQLRATEGFRVEDGEIVQGYPQRFPMGQSSFSVPTLAEEIEMIQGLNRSTGGQVGIYPEIKNPEFHRQHGKDISTAVVQTLKHYGYTRMDSPVFLQTFSFEELRILKQEILPAAGIAVPLVQLIGDAEEYAWMLASDGMEKLAQFADGIGPSYHLVVERDSPAAAPVITPLTGRAHAAGLKVHPYTFRADPGQIPGYAASFDELLEIHLFQAGVDGVFTDFPDRAANFLESRQASQ